MRKSSKYFSEKEVKYSATAEKFKLNNEPTDTHWANISQTLDKLDLIREELGVPLRVNSWYRGEELNAKVGGSKTSDHCNGLAVDLTCGTIDAYNLTLKIEAACKKLGIIYDQLIYEHSGISTWCHIGFGTRKRLQNLTYKAGSYSTGFSK